MSKQEVILCESLRDDLQRAIENCPHDRLFILTDEHTAGCCLPLLKEFPYLNDAVEISISAGDEHKNLQALAAIWQVLSDRGATRHSLLINLGGGMVTDVGGFAAATFKRGMNYINIPTTLLSMVDAAVGGKTGVNFNGLKNEVGVFAPAAYVLLCVDFLRTLDRENFLSGYAEMLKHGLISTPELWHGLLALDTEQTDSGWLKHQVDLSVKVKMGVVEQDPNERGLRKALNLGHTVGHAFESLALARKQPILHGYAVAWGLLCELYLSHVKVGFPKEQLRLAIDFVKNEYGSFYIDCKQYDTLYRLMQHDKKNSGDTISFTLLRNVGDVVIDQTADKDTLFEMFDFFRECMGF